MAYIYMQLPPGLEHPSAELHEEWLIYMQLPPGLEHPSAELHEEWLIYMQLPPSTVPSPLNLEAFGRP